MYHFFLNFLIPLFYLPLYFFTCYRIRALGRKRNEFVTSLDCLFLCLQQDRECCRYGILWWIKCYPVFLGEIPDLFPDEEVENIISNMRNEVKTHGLMDTREACWKFFIERVRRQLKVGPALFCCMMFLMFHDVYTIYLQLMKCCCLNTANGGRGRGKRDIYILDNTRIIITFLCRKKNRV